MHKKDKKNYSSLVETKNDYIRGTIKFKRNGSALFFPDQNDLNAPYKVEKNDTHISLHGDIVIGRIIHTKNRQISNRKRIKKNLKKVEAIAENVTQFRVLKVIERAKKTYIGTFFKRQKSSNYILADDPRIIPEFHISKNTNKSNNLKLGDHDKVVFKIINWNQRQIPPEVEILEILGKTHEPKAEFSAILLKYDLDLSFPDKIESQARSSKNELTDNNLKKG